MYAGSKEPAIAAAAATTAVSSIYKGVRVQWQQQQQQQDQEKVHAGSKEPTIAAAPAARDLGGRQSSVAVAATAAG